MVERAELLLSKLRFLFIGMLVLASLILVSIMVASTVTAKGIDVSASSQTEGMADSPNAVTNGMSSAADGLGRSIDTTEKRLIYGLRTTGKTVSHSGQFVGHGLQVSASFAARSVSTSAKFIGLGLKNSALFVVHTTGSGIGFAARTTGSVIGFVSNTPVVSAVIKPSASAPLPVIDPNSPTLFASKVTVPAVQTDNQAAAQQPASQNPAPPDTSATWPIHGEITTLFGVPHWPYQPTHTGIDISDGQPSGATGVKPYRPGRVVDATRSYNGLGNHVVVDHGGGITSVYGHMSSISVSIGQDVDKNTTLGFEGSTGASTGTHLHFEIRVNGQPVDPLQYVNGRP